MYPGFIQLFKLDPNATIPTRAHETDGGLDLYALEDVFIPYQTTRKISTGVAINIPENYIGKVFDRSSMALKGLSVGAGVVDHGYTGSVDVVIHNLTNHHDVDLTYRSGYWVRKGDKVAQLVVILCSLAKPMEVDNLWISERGAKGFGSSGR